MPVSPCPEIVHEALEAPIFDSPNGGCRHPAAVGTRWIVSRQHSVEPGVCTFTMARCNAQSTTPGDVANHPSLPAGPIVERLALQHAGAGSRAGHDLPNCLPIRLALQFPQAGAGAS